MKKTAVPAAPDPSLEHAPDGAGPPACQDEESHDDCSSCDLYKWYPPLLLLSTIMAGVFCCLYLTKPVFVVPAGGGAPVSGSPAVELYHSGEEESDLEPKTAQVPAPLNPEQGSLPGEDPAAAPLPGGLQPLRGAGEGGATFRPLAGDATAKGTLPPQQVIIGGVQSEPIRVDRDVSSQQPLRIVQRIPDTTSGTEEMEEVATMAASQSEAEEAGGRNHPDNPPQQACAGDD